MRRLFVCGAAAVALAGTASIAQAGPWSGGYIGAQLGANWQNADTTNSAPAAPFSVVTIPALANGGIPTATTQDDTSFAGGADLGVNFESGTFVWGLEGDWTWLGADETSTTVQPAIGGNPAITTVQQAKTNWLATGRLRAGFLASPDTLIYATGGVAFADVEGHTDLIPTGGSSCANNSICSVGSVSDTKTGWTLGGGVEHKIAPKWSLRVDYLYSDLGDLTYDATEASPAFLPAAAGLSNLVIRTEFTEHTVRLGLNFQF